MLFLVLIKLRNFTPCFLGYLVFDWTFNSNFLIELISIENKVLISLRIETLAIKHLEI